jgi:peroxiredoxin
MSVTWVVSSIVLWGLVLFLSFLLLGTLRLAGELRDTLGYLRFRLKQVEARMPRRRGRDGLRPGQKAPDFPLPKGAGPEVALSDLTSRWVMLVFTHSRCSPCRRLLPVLSRVQSRGKLQVVVVNSGDATDDPWAAGQPRVCFPVVVQEQRTLSRRYEIVRTPFTFLIDEQSVIRWAGVIRDEEDVRYALREAAVAAASEHVEAPLARSAAGKTEVFLPVTEEVPS